MPFEKFTARRCPKKDVSMLSILKHGIFGLNQAVYDKYFKKFKGAFLFFDKYTNRIGIRPTNEPARGAYNIRVLPNGRRANISAKAFLKYYKIPHKDLSKSYTCEWKAKDKLLVIRLNKKQAVKRRRVVKTKKTKKR